MSYCQRALNRYVLLIYMPSYLPAGCTGKIASYLIKNLLGLIIWKRMYGIAWVRNTSLNIEKTPLDVADFLGYNEYIKIAEPESWQQITKSKPISYSDLNAFCTNLIHNNKKFGTWNSKFTSKSGIYEKHLNLLHQMEFNFSERTNRKK